MTKKELSGKIKYIEQEYLLTLGIYQVRQLGELMDTLSIRHPQYDQLEGFVGFVNSRLQANEELKSYLHSLTPCKDVLDEIYSAVECKYSVHLKIRSFVVQKISLILSAGDIHSMTHWKKLLILYTNKKNNGLTY